jgi:SAM-dependent methyltransferase
MLDAGCGNGIDTLRMAERSGQLLVSMDLSRAGIEQARRRTRHLPNVHVVQADLESIPLRTEQFDFVYSYGVLHHLPRPDRALAELVRVLKKGGGLALYVYEDFETRSWGERLLLKAVNQLRHVTVRMPPRWLYGLCRFCSPLVFLGLTVPAKLLARIPSLEPLSRRIPYHHGKRPFGLTGDLYDRFAVPIERRYSRSAIGQWLTRMGLTDVQVHPLRGWVGYGRKASAPVSPA